VDEIQVKKNLSFEAYRLELWSRD